MISIGNRTNWIAAIEAALSKKNVLWINGIRRSGKTTLCKSLKNTEYFDCEKPSVRRALEDPESFLEENDRKAIVLDEIHRLENPSEILKLAHDHYPKTKVIATGSSTLFAKDKFKDTLVGRKTDLWLTPMNCRDLEDLAQDPPFSKNSIERRMLRGGLPGFFLSEDWSYSLYTDWIDGYWAKDVQELFRIEKRASFLKFIEMLMQQSGGIFEPSHFASSCGVTHPTITNYLNVLETTHIASVLGPYFSNKNKEIISAPKIYGFDTGFVSYFKEWDKISADNKGLLWEMLVLNEIYSVHRKDEVFYWRDKQKHEVDFIVKRRGQAPVAIECKWKESEFDPRAMQIFRKTYKDGKNILVCFDAIRRVKKTIAGLEFEVMPLTQLNKSLG